MMALATLMMSDVANARPRPAPAPATIVALGTSLTALGGWPDALQAAFAARHCRIKVVTIARPGMNSRWGRLQLDRVVAARPAAVLIEFAATDAALTHFVPLLRSRATMQAIRTELHQRVPGIRLWTLGMSPAWGLRGWVRPLLNRYTDAHLQDTAASGDGVIDFRADWGRLPASRRRALIPDGVHPTRAAATGIMLPRLTATLAGLCHGEGHP